LCPEESLRRFEEEEIFLADAIAACEKCGLIVAGWIVQWVDFLEIFSVYSVLSIGVSRRVSIGQEAENLNTEEPREKRGRREVHVRAASL